MSNSGPAKSFEEFVTLFKTNISLKAKFKKYENYFNDLAKTDILAEISQTNKVKIFLFGHCLVLRNANRFCVNFCDLFRKLD